MKGWDRKVSKAATATSQGEWVGAGREAPAVLLSTRDSTQYLTTGRIMSLAQPKEGCDTEQVEKQLLSKEV